MSLDAPHLEAVLNAFDRVTEDIVDQLVTALLARGLDITAIDKAITDQRRRAAAALERYRAGLMALIEQGNR